MDCRPRRVRQAIDAATAAYGPAVVLVEHRLDD